MACPKCGCKVTYPVYEPGECGEAIEDKERCSNCNHIFWIWDADDDDDEMIEDPTLDPKFNPLI